MSLHYGKRIAGTGSGINRNAKYPLSKLPVIDYIEDNSLILRIDPADASDINSIQNSVTSATIPSGGNFPSLDTGPSADVSEGNKALRFTYSVAGTVQAYNTAQSLIPDVAFELSVCTVHVWVKPDRTIAYSPNYTGRATIFGATPTTNSFAYDSLWINGSSPYRLFGETSTNNQNYSSFNSSITGEQWNCITIVGSGGNTYTTYINGGTLSGGTQNTRTGISGNISYGSIGAPGQRFFGSYDYEVPFGGWIGHILWYSNDLSAQQVSDMYELQKERYTVRSGT